MLKFAALRQANTKQMIPSRRASKHFGDHNVSAERPMSCLVLISQGIHYRLKGRPDLRPELFRVVSSPLIND